MSDRMEFQTFCPHCNNPLLFTLSKGGEPQRSDTSYGGLQKQFQQAVDSKLEKGHKPCTKCGADVYWNKSEHTETGKWKPYNADGAAHRCRQQ